MLSPEQITDASYQALNLVLVNSIPTMLAAAGAGLAIAILQALTQVQDQGLPTAVKFFAVMGVLYLTYLGMAESITGYADHLFLMIERL